MEGKNIIYFYRDWWDFLEDLDMQQRGEWITYVMQYVNDLSPVLPNDKQVMSICKITRNQLKRDLEDWKKSIEKKSEAGKKGMASRWGKEIITNDNNVITSDNNVITTNNDKDIVKDKEKDKVIDKDKDIDKDISNIDACVCEEELHIETLKQLQEMIEANIYCKPLSTMDSFKLKCWVEDYGLDMNNIYRDLLEYQKRPDIKDPMNYMSKCLEKIKNPQPYKQPPQEEERDEEKYRYVNGRKLVRKSKWLDDFMKNGKDEED